MSSADATNAPRMEFNFEHTFDAPRDRVFLAWSEGKYMEQWWGPHGSTNPVRVWDTRSGGRIHIDMVAADGEVHPQGGSFLEFVPPERIVFLSTAFQDEAGEPRFVTRNTVTFAEHDSKTTVAVNAVVVKAFSGVLQALDGIELGWTQSLERLEDVVRKL